MTQLATVATNSTLMTPPTAPPPIADNAVTVIAPNDRGVNPCPYVPGLSREACVDEEGVWIGMVTAEPGTASAWHDHGDRTTYLFPLCGDCVIEYGPQGEEQRVHLIADGSVYVVPPHLRHREVNDNATPVRAFQVRLGPKG